jgi:hypothetical protein
MKQNPFRFCFKSGTYAVLGETVSRNGPMNMGVLDGL